MTITTKITFNNYVKLMLILSFRNVRLILFSIIGINMLLLPLFYLTGLNDKTPYLTMILGLFVLIIPSVMVYISSKKNYASNTRMQEKIIYEFTDEYIEITGETFKTVMDWSKIYKILELRGWILIYQNIEVATIIPKASFGENITAFRKLVKSKNIKSKLY